MALWEDSPLPGLQFFVSHLIVPISRYGLMLIYYEIMIGSLGDYVVRFDAPSDPI